MEGTNVEKGKQMLRESGLNFATADDMNEAAAKVVASARGARLRTADVESGAQTAEPRVPSPGAKA
jgi:hypothetical protein